MEPQWVKFLFRNTIGSQRQPSRILWDLFHEDLQWWVPCLPKKVRPKQLGIVFQHVGGQATAKRFSFTISAATSQEFIYISCLSLSCVPYCFNKLTSGLECISRFHQTLSAHRDKRGAAQKGPWSSESLIGSNKMGWLYKLECHILPEMPPKTRIIIIL